MAPLHAQGLLTRLGIGVGGHKWTGLGVVAKASSRGSIAVKHDKAAIVGTANIHRCGNRNRLAQLHHLRCYGDATNNLRMGIGRRVVEGRFDGGSMTSDAGVMLLEATDRQLGLSHTATRCMVGPRNPLLICRGHAAPTRVGACAGLGGFERPPSSWPGRCHANFSSKPTELVLDFDATNNPLYGQQESRFFHGYYDAYGDVPNSVAGLSRWS